MGYYERYSYVEKIDGKPMRFATEEEAKEYRERIEDYVENYTENESQENDRANV